MVKISIKKQIFPYFLAISALTTLMSCSSPEMNKLDKSLRKGLDFADPELKKDRDSFERDLTGGERLDMPYVRKEPALLEMSDIIVAPRPPMVGEDKLISLSVTEDVALKDVLIEIAKLANIDIDIDSEIQGGIILKVTDKPIPQVIERIARIAHLRYGFEHGILKIERDLPYMKTHSVDFLNLIRSNEGTVSLNTQTVGSGDSGGSGSSGSSSSSSSSGSSGGSSSAAGSSSGSTNSIKSSYEGDIWKSVAEGVNNILEIMPSSANNVLPFTNPTMPNATPKRAVSVTFNKAAGIINVYADSKQQREVSMYLESVRRSVSAQVLIEAKVVEVTLNKSFQAGIDWTLLQMPGIKSLSYPFVGTAPFPSNISAGSGATSLATILGGGLNIGIQGAADKKRGFNKLTAAVQLLEQFGTTRTLSSPRVHAMNNQQAVLTFADNQIYFTVELQQQSQTTTGSASTNNTAQVSSTLHTVPIGVMLNLQPSINLDTNEVTINIRPTISKIIGNISDPAVKIQQNQLGILPANQVDSQVPVIDVKEIDSVMKIQSGEVMVIGGLMEDVVSNGDTGVPYLMRMPILGNLFKTSVRSKNVTETVIFIKATIIPSSAPVTKPDQDFYNKFVRERDQLIF